MTDKLPPSDSDNGADAGDDRWNAIARFLAGESAPADAADARRWLTEHPGDAETVAALERLLPVPKTRRAADMPADGTLPFVRPVDVEGALRRVHARMETSPAAEPLSRGAARPRVPAMAPRRAQRSWTTWAGGALLAAGAAFAAVGTVRHRGGAAVSTVARVYETPVGTRDSVLLPDSSRVILAPGSRLVVAAGFANGDRRVELQGAGQFTVHHDAAHPFSVHAGSALIEDLGTVFSVKALPHSTVVAVMEGSVSLSDSSATQRGAAVRLQAGDRGRLEANGAVVAERGAVTPEEASWVRGTLTYHDALLGEVQADLRRWYGVELVVTDSALRTRLINHTAAPGDSVDKIVEALATSWGAVATWRGDTVFVVPSEGRPRR